MTLMFLLNEFIPLICTSGGKKLKLYKLEMLEHNPRLSEQREIREEALYVKKNREGGPHH